MKPDDVIFETADVCVLRSGHYTIKSYATAAMWDMAEELARLYQQLEEKEDDGK